MMLPIFFDGRLLAAGLVPPSQSSSLNLCLDQIVHNTCALEAAVIAAIGLTALALAHLLRTDATPLKDVRNKFQITSISLRDARSSLKEAKAAETLPD
jgi:hypothetical protein